MKTKGKPISIEKRAVKRQAYSGQIPTSPRPHFKLLFTSQVIDTMGITAPGARKTTDLAVNIM